MTMSWIRIVKSIKQKSDDDELEKISKLVVNTPERVRPMNETKYLNLAAAEALCIPLPSSLTENNIYHTTVLVN